MRRANCPSFLVSALIGVFTLVGCATAASPTPTPPPTAAPTRTSATSAAPATTCPLTVQVTATGSSVWGVVTVAYDSKTVNVTAAKQTVAVPCGTTVTLTQKPAHAKSWKFKDWMASGASASAPSAYTTRVTLHGPTTVTAQYQSGSASKGWG